MYGPQHNGSSFSYFFPQRHASRASTILISVNYIHTLWNPIDICIHWIFQKCPWRRYFGFICFYLAWVSNVFNTNVFFFVINIIFFCNKISKIFYTVLITHYVIHTFLQIYLTCPGLIWLKLCICAVICIPEEGCVTENLKYTSC